MSMKNKIDLRIIIVILIATLFLLIGFPVYFLYSGISGDPQTNYELYKKTAPSNATSLNDVIYQIETGNRKFDTAIKYFTDNWKHMKAMRYLKKAAEQGHAEAQYDLSMEYYMVYGENNIKKGNEWLFKAGKNGSVRAMKDLGFLHMNNEKVYRLYFPEDYKKAFEWYQKAADKGDLDSLLQIAYLHSVGKGIQKNLKMAEELYRKAASKKPEMAYNGLAWMWAEEGIKLDEAEKMAKEALKLNPESAYILDTLGWVYYKQKKYKQAEEKLAKAAEIENLPIILDHLGDALLAQGKKKKARKQWEDALRDCNDPDLIRKINSKLNQLNSPSSK